MYLAELHGKLSSKNENREDILTSNVFSFFKYSDRIKFLKPFLKSIGIEISEYEAQKADFSFWPVYEEGTEPDLVITTENYYILIEAKYFSDFSKETKKTKAQLIRELEMGKLVASNLKKKFIILAITSDYCYKKDKFEIIPTDSRGEHFIWTNWQKVSEHLFEILNTSPNLHDIEILFSTDLYNLLARKRLRKFQMLILKNAKLSFLNSIFLNVSKLKNKSKFSGFINIFEKKKKLRTKIPNYFYCKRSYFSNIFNLKLLKPTQNFKIFKEV